MKKGQEAVITEHREVLPPSRVEPLCGTVLLGAHSFAFELPTSGDVELGRGPDADLQILGGGVSRAHARLHMSGDRATVEDLESRNGTFVNAQRATTPLGAGHGDEVGIGDARILLFRRSALPPGTVPALLRDAFVARLDREIAPGRRPCVFVLQVPERWYEYTPVRDVITKMASSAIFGIDTGNVLAFGVHGSQAETLRLVSAVTRTLRIAGVEVASGVASTAAGGGAELLTDALKALVHAEEEEAETAQQLIVTTPAMIKLHDEARRVAQSPISILLIGETGVGKEVFARTIHRASGRSGPLVAVNAAALPEQLVESELFGHERGAFSGAAAAKVGLVEAAHGGTLFLDEIGELPLAMQAKLLRVLEDRTVRRVGATTERKVDIRVVAATNADLQQAVAEKRFRQDLLFRLNSCTLVIPPLRERRDEVTRLSEIFLVRAAAAMNAPHVRLAPDVMEALTRYDWPGNVRELRNVIERGVALAATAGGTIALEHLPGPIRGAAPSSRLSSPPRMTSANPPPLSDDVRDSLRDFERQQIVAALAEFAGNQTKAAAKLGLPRRTLAYKMARLGIREK